jgi:nucleoside-diphosphate-sugar epimerase
MIQNKTAVLITGGAGFIGSNLCEYFLSKDYFVVCLDNFATGHRHNIEPFFENAIHPLKIFAYKFHFLVGIYLDLLNLASQTMNLVKP